MAEDENVWDRLRRLREELADLQEILDGDEDEDDFLIGWDSKYEKIREADPWIADLWSEHPDLRCKIMPGGVRIDGTTYPPFISWGSYSSITYDNDELLSILEQLGRLRPEGFTYRDVARAIWGEDWTLSDAGELPSKVWAILRHHVRFEKIPQKGGPNIWRMRQPREVARI